MSDLAIQKKEKVQTPNMITSAPIPFKQKLRWFIQKKEQSMKKRWAGLELKDWVNTRAPMTLKNGEI